MLVQGLKLFGGKFTNSYLKAQFFRSNETLIAYVYKSGQLTKNVSKFTPKWFYEIDPHWTEMLDLLK